MPSGNQKKVITVTTWIPITNIMDVWSRSRSQSSDEEGCNGSEEEDMGEEAPVPDTR